MMKTSEQIDQLATALAKAQGELAGAKKDTANPFFKSKYADLASVVEAIKACFPKHGLSYVQTIVTSEDGVGVESRLMHASGQWVEGEPFYLPVNKADAQGFGSCATYARRYSLAALAGVAPEDDDGNAAAAAPPKPITGQQVTQDAFDALPADAQQVVREWAMEVIAIMQDGDVDAAARFVMEKTADGSDAESLLALSSQLDSKVRNPIKKRMQEIHRERRTIAPGTKPIAYASQP